MDKVMRFYRYLKDEPHGQTYMEVIIRDDDKFIHVYREIDTLDEGKVRDIGGGEMVRFDSGNTNTKTQDHLHFFEEKSSYLQLTEMVLPMIEVMDTRYPGGMW
jgi:translation initiation factor RLI1